jgi:hypothetical protein
MQQKQVCIAQFLITRSWNLPKVMMRWTACIWVCMHACMSLSRSSTHHMCVGIYVINRPIVAWFLTRLWHIFHCLQTSFDVGNFIFSKDIRPHTNEWHCSHLISPGADWCLAQQTCGGHVSWELQSFLDPTKRVLIIMPFFKTSNQGFWFDHDTHGYSTNLHALI